MRSYQTLSLGRKATHPRQIANAIVRREATFLAKPEWKTIPWDKSPSSKSDTSRLLDVITGIPALIGGTVGVMIDRITWLIGGCNGERQETPQTVPDLQASVQTIETELAQWRIGWEMRNPVLAPTLLKWAFHRANGDAYRPGINGTQGPDIFDANIFDTAASLNDPAAATWPPDGTGGWALGLDLADIAGLDEQAVFTAMQDIALYTTILVWTTRLTRYLTGAARSSVAVDFFNAPFHTSCTCCTVLPPKPCETNPPPDLAPSVDPAMSWNAGSCRIAVAPTRMQQPLPNMNLLDADADPRRPAGVLPLPLVSAHAAGVEMATLLPADVRFAAQLRVLAWLCERLPRSRPQVLATLAAIGLGHCGHDVRPAEGIREVAETVERVLARTGAEGATDVLLRSYRAVGVEVAG